MKISYDPEVDALYIRLIEGEYECRTLRLHECKTVMWQSRN
ncbi:MAG: DUF2283 domain-containing protein [Candidatus Brocadiaceae bacterium]|nr:DUF2283 domain-containing protein [Candidatus Brocadiaceae bacterium]